MRNIFRKLFPNDNARDIALSFNHANQIVTLTRCNLSKGMHCQHTGSHMSAYSIRNELSRGCLKGWIVVNRANARIIG